MLRMTRSIRNETVWVAFEGRLAGAWVDEARETCRRELAGGRTLALDLSLVSFVDGRGLQLLRELSADGVSMPLRSNFVTELLRPENSP